MTDFCLKPGTVLHSPMCNYKVVKELGHGGFGITYLVEGVVNVGCIPVTVRFALKEHFINTLCHRDPLSQRVAVAQPTQQEVDRSLRAFIAEAQRLKELGISHPNIVKVNEVFEANGTAYFVMEYLDGGSLADYVKQRGRLSFEEMAALMEPVCNCVALLHRNNVAHYDIKPLNIMLVNNDDQLRPVLIDFGLAKHYDGQGNATSSIAAAGYTPGYAPVEQYGGFTSFQPTADVYALGATILFCLTGHTPARSQELRLNDVRNELHALNLSTSAINALLPALEYRPEDRPADAAVLAAAVFHSAAALFTPSQTTVKMPPRPINPPAPTPTDPIPTNPQPTGNRKWLKPTLIAAGIVLALILGYNLLPNFLTAEQMYQKGKSYYDNNQYTEAVVWYRKAADQGYAGAQFELGRCFANGWGVTKDYNEAVRWFRKAADQGHAEAQYELGVCYEYGQGVTQDYNEAVRWLRKAADQGDASAQNNLGYCYAHGRGVTQDYNEAVRWYRKATDQGNAAAQSNLGYCYERGNGVPQDYNEAVRWYRKAADQGNAVAQIFLANCYENGWGVPYSEFEALKWYRKAAAQGSQVAKQAVQRLESEGYM